jgi:hypothetical protein
MRPAKKIDINNSIYADVRNTKKGSCVLFIALIAT